MPPSAPRTYALGPRRPAAEGPPAGGLRTLEGAFAAIRRIPRTADLPVNWGTMTSRKRPNRSTAPRLAPWAAAGALALAIGCGPSPTAAVILGTDRPPPS